MEKVNEMQNDIERISRTIQKLHEYIKEVEHSPWAVSLRDVNRFCKIMVYFNDVSI
jgi:uncharacterized protein YoxC